MIAAKEARELLNTNLKKQIDMQLEDIEEEIRAECLVGTRLFYTKDLGGVHEDIILGVKETLLNSGYEVEYNSDGGRLRLRITW